MNKLTSILLIAASGSVAHANGFLLNEFDAKATGRGDATAATDTDASSIYYNIGGLAAGEGTQVQVGGSLITPIASFTDIAGTKIDSNTGTQFIPGIFGSTHVTDMIAVGVGFYTPFGLAVQWPSTAETAASASYIKLASYFITPSVGLNLGSIVPGLTVGGGFDIVPATIELKQTVFFGSDPPGTAHLGGTATGIGGRLGVMYRPQSLPRLSVGAMWRSTVHETFSGTGDFESSPEYRGMLPGNGNVTTSTVPLPQTVTGAVAYRPIDALELEGDVVWTNWSQFKTLTINVPTPDNTGTMPINQPENYNNTFSARIGGEYDLNWLGAAVRAGFIYDPTPIPSTTLSPQLPDIDRYDVTVGASKSVGQYTAALGLLWVLPNSNKTSSAMYQPDLKGTYDVQAFVATVTVSGKFGSLTH